MREREISDGFLVSSSAYGFGDHGQEMESRRRIRFLGYMLINAKSVSRVSVIVGQLCGNILQV